jgi:hypothetical protein
MVFQCPVEVSLARGPNDQPTPASWSDVVGTAEYVCGRTHLL